MFKSEAMGVKLKEARKASGLTQHEAGRCICADHRVVGDIEKARRRVSTYELTKLAKLYNKPISYFFNDAELRSDNE